MTNRTRHVYYNGTEYTVHISEFRGVVSVTAYRGLPPTDGHKDFFYYRNWNRRR